MDLLGAPVLELAHFEPVGGFPEAQGSVVVGKARRGANTRFDAGETHRAAPEPDMVGRGAFEVPAPFPLVRHVPVQLLWPRIRPTNSRCGTASALADWGVTRALLALSTLAEFHLKLSYCITLLFV